MTKPTLIICGAGIAGVSAAYFLSQQWRGNIYLIDENPPLSLTSDRSSECYRNWWSDAAMLALMNRSIDLLEGLAGQTGNAFHLNRRGYLYITAQAEKIESMFKEAASIAEQGGGDLRVHEQFSQTYSSSSSQKVDGADMLIGSKLIRQHFPYITEKAVAALHVRRAGWLSAQQLGMVLLQKAQQNGVRFRRARLIGVEVGARVKGVQLSNGEHLSCDVLVNATGPYLKEVGKLLEVDLPVENDLHLKMSLRDPLGVIGREAPLLIWSDAQCLDWSEEEREELAADPQTQFLLSTLPPGAHVRPEGGEDSQMVLMLWDYQSRPFLQVIWPPPLDEFFAEVVLRGLSTLLPGLKAYLNKMPRPQLDGGYYTHTIENRPLIGPLPLEGAYVFGALSGFGIMAACAGGELIAAHILGNPLAPYADAFVLQRYQGENYLPQLLSQVGFGQL
ncbi:MAG: FAD-binding oxidoreductase [Anaerolineales bacterium]|nr:FAD-binding oxidoreductase [Anaerolineales bacterium]